MLRHRGETRTSRVSTSPLKKSKSGVGTKKISLENKTDIVNKDTPKDKGNQQSSAECDDQPSTSRAPGSNTSGQISKSFLTPGPAVDIIVSHEEEPVEEERLGSDSIELEINDSSDIDDLDLEQDEAEHEDMSDVSDSVYSLSGQRSRIPIPVSGSLTAHNLVSI